MRIVALVAIAGCSKAPPKQPPPAAPKDAAVVVVDVAVPAVAPLPAHGVANSAVASAPRTDWPCRIVSSLDGGASYVSTFTYGKRTHCWLPFDVAGSHLLAGCPDEKYDQSLANKLDVRESYRYDDDGHLVEITTVYSDIGYQWDGDLVLARTFKNTPIGYRATVNGAELVDADGNRERGELAGGHLVHYTHGESDDTTFTWKGTRLVGIKTSIGTTRVDYDCSKPPR